MTSTLTATMTSSLTATMTSSLTATKPSSLNAPMTSLTASMTPVCRYRQAEVPLHGTAGRYRKNSTKSAVGARIPAQTDQSQHFCEFQAGSSFDLPNIATLQVTCHYVLS